jgi:hypothetical protein
MHLSPPLAVVLVTRTEAKAINREFYRYEGGGSTTATPDGRWLASASIRLCPGVTGYGLSADHVVATAFAYQNLKRKCFVV